MGRKAKYTNTQYLAAIENSGGNISLIAKRMQCTRRTIERKLKAPGEVLDAYEAETNRILDVAKTVILKNIELNAKIQEEQQIVVDTTDAKWWLSKKDKEFKDSIAVEGKLELSIPEGKAEAYLERLGQAIAVALTNRASD
jgi:hypothetical protein